MRRSRGQVRIEPLSSPDEMTRVLAVEEASFTNPWTRAMYVAELENRNVSYCYLAKDEDGRGAWVLLPTGTCSTSCTSTTWP